jgi:AraC family transcriptional regulator
MKSDLGEMLAVSNLGATLSSECMHRVSKLVNAAVSQLHDQEHPAHCTPLEAASLLKQQIGPRVAREVPYGRAYLLAWEARKVLDYIGAQITRPVRVADLCVLIHRSEAHFSRLFKHTFGEPPHAFIIRRRVDLATQYMLQTDASLSDIAFRCGFVDQSHLCKHFRQVLGQTPAAWRRERRTQQKGSLLNPIREQVAA